MYARDQRAQVGDKLGKGFAEGFPSSDQHIVMLSDKVTRACCHSRPKTTFYAIAFWGIAGLLGDREADARLGIGHCDGLQPKRRAPGAIAPGSPLKLGTLGQPAQGAWALLAGRHPANRP
jgi:hypothetical protein